MTWICGPKPKMLGVATNPLKTRNLSPFGRIQLKTRMLLNHANCKF